MPFEVPGLPCQNVAGRLAMGLPLVALPIIVKPEREGPRHWIMPFEVPGLPVVRSAMGLPISVKPEREGQHLARTGRPVPVAHAFRGSRLARGALGNRLALGGRAGRSCPFLAYGDYFSVAFQVDQNLRPCVQSFPAFFQIVVTVINPFHALYFVV